MVNSAIESVKDKPLPAALWSLVNLFKAPDVEALKATVEEERNKSPLLHLIPMTFVDGKGRAIARQPQNEEEAVLAHMFRKATELQSIGVQGLIELARQRILLDHYVKLGDFGPIVSSNTFIPPGRETIVARGLYAGLHGDFLTSTHFLCPQLEHSVWYILYQMNIIPAALNDQGLQEEYNLNRLLSATEFTEPLSTVIGEDFIFDMRSLLIEKFGSNLRNEMAHGLLDSTSFRY